jgi:glyoxylase-like metal-dependent hydrolase (beta-lactamase superfamily II)
MVPFTKGLHEIGDDVFAYLQPTGSWGYSNAGLLAGDGTSLLIDTLIDLKLTREMLSAMRQITETKPIDTLINTHANGDHCWGNQLVPERADIYTTVATAEEMRLVSPQMIEGLKHTADPELKPFVDIAFGDFSLDEINPRMPDHTFTDSLSLTIGGREVRVRDLGPAHTDSDSIVYMPDSQVVFTGDLVFVEGTPIAWSGPVGNWIRACEELCTLDAKIVVPGHGPVTDKDGVRTVKRYFEHVQREAHSRQDAGMGSLEAAFDIDLGELADLADSERIVVTVDTIYRDRDATAPERDPIVLFREMGRYRRDRAKR